MDLDDEDDTRRQVWSYLAAILAERVSGSLFPGLAGVVEVWLWPVPGLLLDTTFVQVPLLHVRDAFRDRRSVGRQWPLFDGIRSPRVNPTWQQKRWCGRRAGLD